MFLSLYLLYSCSSVVYIMSMLLEIANFSCSSFLVRILILGFVLLMGLIYSIYELLGRYLVKVGNKNGK